MSSSITVLSYKLLLTIEHLEYTFIHHNILPQPHLQLQSLLHVLQGLNVSVEDEGPVAHSRDLAFLVLDTFRLAFLVLDIFRLAFLVLDTFRDVGFKPHIF